uniref:Ig-like domain-containing protein n=1 Tax=Pelusios castaneus TaxID=367368 RepID=A0A8C8S1Y2_9SAUR
AAWPPQLICMLPLLSLAGSGAQHVVTQPPSESGSLGQTVRLSCSISGGYSISSNGVSWFQQSPGNPPRYLLYYVSDSSTGRGSGVPDRFSGSASGSTGYLTISGLQAEDDADYYCLTWDTVAQGERFP